MARVAAAARRKTSEDAKKSKETKEKNPPKPRSHPPASEMVLEAIKNLADKKGSSLPAIKKYIAGHYLLDIARQATFIRKYLKKAVESKTLVQTKGSGASGRFKFPRKIDAQEKTDKPPAKRGRPKKDEAVAKEVKTSDSKTKKSAKKEKSTTNKVKSSESKAKKSAAPKKTPKVRRARAVRPPRSPKPKISAVLKTKTSTASKSIKSKAAKK